MDLVWDYSLCSSGIQIDRNDYNQRGDLYQRKILLNNDMPLNNRITYNGQTLWETRPQIRGAGYTGILDNTGNFYVSGTAAHLNVEFPTGTVRNIWYDVNHSGSDLIYTSYVRTGIFITSPDDFVNYRPPATGQDHYFNGIKLVSGIHYTGNLLFVALPAITGVTGRLFAIPPKIWDIKLISSGSNGNGGGDLFGKKFAKETVSLYLNGVRQKPDIFLETSTLISGLINTGTIAYNKSVDKAVNINYYNIN